jgi:hypothetical protein
VPGVVDLAAMRDAVAALGGRADSVNPLVPVDLVIDHSVVVDVAGPAGRLRSTPSIEFDRNLERYRFLRWGQAFLQLPPRRRPTTGSATRSTSSCSRSVIFSDDAGNAYPDSLVGTDSHTPMANGLSIVAWGVGGIEAEAAMLGQPISMLVPPVVGLRSRASCPRARRRPTSCSRSPSCCASTAWSASSSSATDRASRTCPVENRATIGNMSPEYGSTITIFPIDDQTLRYLRLTGRSASARRARRGLRQGAGPLARPDDRAGLLRDALARPLDRRPEPRRPVAAPGPRPARPLQGDVRELARSLLPRGATRDGAPDAPGAPALGNGDDFEIDHGTSSSPRSRAARTPRTRR